MGREGTLLSVPRAALQRHLVVVPDDDRRRHSTLEGMAAHSFSRSAAAWLEGSVRLITPRGLWAIDPSSQCRLGAVISMTSPDFASSAWLLGPMASAARLCGVAVVVSNDDGDSMEATAFAVSPPSRTIASSSPRES